MTPSLSSGLAELIGYLLVAAVPLLASMVGSALATAAGALAAVAVVHAVGLGIALGGHRLHRRGHWLARPLLFTLALSILAVGCLASYGVLIGDALGDREVTWWVSVAPASALLAQVAGATIVALFSVDRLVRVSGDYARALGAERSEASRARVWTSRATRLARGLSAGVWSLAALALLAGAILGLVVVVPLAFVAGDGSARILGVHGLVMLVSGVGAVVLLVRRVALLRDIGRSARDWSATLRGRPRASGLGQLGRAALSLSVWVAGELGLYASGVLFAVSALFLTLTVRVPEGDRVAVVGLALVVFAFAAVGFRVFRLGGWLRPVGSPIPLEPGAKPAPEVAPFVPPVAVEPND